MTIGQATAGPFDQNRISQPAAAADNAASRSHLLALLIVLCVGAFYLATIRQGHDWGDDFSLYIQHARNILQGRDYRAGGYLHYPPYIGPDAYPPVYPLLIVPVYWLFGMNLTALKVELILAFLAALLLFWLMVKDSLPVGWQAALLALVGFNPYFWGLKDRILSELPFLALAYLVMYLVQRAYQSKAPESVKLFYGLGTGVALYLAYGTRSIGILLLPCLFLYDLLRNRRFTLFAVAAGGAMIALVALQSLLLHNNRGYFVQFQTGAQDFFSDWVKYILDNLKQYVLALVQLWDNGYAKLPRVTLTVVISGLAVVGYLARVRKPISFVELFVPLYLIAVIAVPMEGGIRFLVPIIPFYVFYALLGLKALPPAEGAKTTALAGLMVAVLASYAARYTTLNFKQVPNSITDQESAEFLNYVTGQTAASDVFIFTKPRALALLTGRKSSFYPELLDDKGLWNYFQRIHATHIAVGPRGMEPEDQAFLTAFVAKYSGSLRQEYANAEFQVYRITGIPQASGRIDYVRRRLTDPRPQQVSETTEK